MKLNKTFFILVGIVAIALFFRIYQLTSVPPSASLDEASIGWNAYSILNTGKDEYGYKFPILLRAYDDWRPALYVYLVIPFIKFIGLDVLAVRLPSAILGTLAVLITYFLTIELFPKYKHKKHLGLLSSFFLAISPWSIYISRLGHEANAGFVFGIFAIFSFLKFKNSLKSFYLYFSSVFFALSFYAYQTEKIFVPLIVFVLAVLFRNELFQRKKHLILAALLGFMVLIPVLQSTLSPNGLIRLKGTNAFDVNQSQYVYAAQERLSAKEHKDIIREIVNNNRIVSAKIFLENYSLHFDPFWLFSNRGLDSFKAPGVGLLYLFELPLILLGVFYLLFKQSDKKVKIFLGAWIIISPIAGSITTGAPQAMRSYNFLPALQILSSLGLLYIFYAFNREWIKKIFAFVIGIVFVVSVFYFFRQYLVAFPKEESSSFQYSFSQSVPYALQNSNKFNKVVFSNKRNLNQSYMFFLFYSKHDPHIYQKEGTTISGGFEKMHKIGKYEFDAISMKNISKNVLYIGSPFESPKKSDKYFNVINFKDLDGSVSAVAFYLK